MMTYLLAAAGPSDAPSLLGSLAPMFLIFLIFYVVWFMPMRKKQKALDQLVTNLKKGDKVVTSGGFYGEVAKVEGPIVLLKLADNVKVRVSKRAISGLEETAVEKRT